MNVKRVVMNEKMDRLIARAISMGDLVDYQEGAVVSRTIIAKPTGTVTLFAFDKGQGLSTHSAPFDALVIILEGDADHHFGQGAQGQRGRDDHHACQQASCLESHETFQNGPGDGEVITGVVAP